jgi:hypothetical protein
MDQVAPLANPCTRTRRATIIPLRLTERLTPFLVNCEMFFEEAMMCALTLMLTIGIATVLAFALSVLPSVSNLSLGTETERSTS